MVNLCDIYLIYLSLKFHYIIYSLILIIPYILVLIGGIAGLNVFVTLLIGIVSGIIIVLSTGTSTFVELIGNAGSGVTGMYDTAMVAILVSGMCELIREDGGFAALLAWIKKLFKGKGAGAKTGCDEFYLRSFCRFIWKEGFRL